jgi:hypothetical protein
MYDDSGVNSCTAAACDLSASHGSRPTLTLSGVNGLPVVTCASTPTGIQILSSFNLSTPFTSSLVAERTGSIAVQSGFGAHFGGLMYFAASSGVMGTYNGGTDLTTLSGLTESAFHALQVMQDSTTKIQGDGQAIQTGAAGTLGVASGNEIAICSDAFGDALTGAVAEVWIGSGDQSATFGSAHSNQSTAYGTP